MMCSIVALRNERKLRADICRHARPRFGAVIGAGRRRHRRGLERPLFHRQNLEVRCRQQHKVDDPLTNDVADLRAILFQRFPAGCRLTTLRGRRPRPGPGAVTPKAMSASLASAIMKALLPEGSARSPRFLRPVIWSWYEWGLTKTEPLAVLQPFGEGLKPPPRLPRFPGQRRESKNSQQARVRPVECSGYGSWQ